MARESFPVFPLSNFLDLEWGFISINMVDKMDEYLSTVSLIVKASPAMSDASRGQDVLVDVSLYSEVHRLGYKLSVLLGIPADQLWLFHNGCHINRSNNRGLCWACVRGFIENPVVLYYKRKGPPSSFDRMCLVELESLQQRRFSEILALGRHQDHRRLTAAELEYLRVYCAVIAVKEREKDLQKALEKAVWRYSICSRRFIGPPLGYIKAVAAKVKEYADKRASGCSARRGMSKGKAQDKKGKRSLASGARKRSSLHSKGFSVL